MNTKIILIALLSVFSIGQTFSQTLVEQEIKELSKNKWQWMADKDTEKLSQLFHENAQYVHMGGYWGTER